MPKLYFVRDELGGSGPYYPTLKQAQSDFQDQIDDGSEPEGVHSIHYVSTRKGIAALLNSIRPESD